MIPAQHHHQSGFSAVELLITLFVAVAFLATGYQLYYAVLESSGQTRMRAMAHNIASDYIRFQATQVPTTCTGAALVSPPIDFSTGVQGIITSSNTCPYGTGSSITRIDVSIQFKATPGSESEVIKHAIYASPYFR